MCLGHSNKALPVHFNDLVALHNPSILSCNPSRRSDTLDKDAQLLQPKLSPSPKPHDCQAQAFGSAHKIHLQGFQPCHVLLQLPLPCC